MTASDRRARTNTWMALAAIAAAAGCSSGGGDDSTTPPPPPSVASCTNDVANFVGVCTGFPDGGNLDWNAGGDGSGGVGDGGASGDGGVGAGGDFGQFRNVTISVFREDGTSLGSALTDNVKGMVTIRPGRTYTGSLRVELRGGPNAEYFEEGKNRFVPFPTDRVIRVLVPRVETNIGITPFTEAAYQMLTQGTADESVAGTATPAQIRAANARVATLLNEHFPKALEVRNITRLPFIKSPTVAQGSLNINERGVYGVVNGAFSKQAALYNTSSATPTLDAVKQLSEDLRDGKLDGFNGNLPAAPVGTRTYDPQTLTSELTAALAQQAERFGSQALKDTLPKLVNFGGTRYEGYLFDTSVNRSRQAVSTVAGWLGANTLNLTIGSGPPKLLPAGQTAHSMVGNMGHGGAFFKIDSTDTTATPVYRTYALGDNVNGELGTGGTSSTARQLVEINLPGAMTHAAGGFAHTVFRLGDGRVFTVGDNTYGQLGQGGSAGTPARSLVPVEVSFPPTAGGAVAVAATSVASYALMADGTVYAWGSNGGFGLLGNGQATGTQTTPALVAGLSDVVQISARDNDVVALKRDQSILQWGSHPADVNAYTDGDVTSPYRGGTFTPTAVTGLPTFTVNGQVRAVPVRKIITEQGLFGALLANGHVYTWGVHFDLSAKAVLRDLQAARVLGVPPLRDMMPGGFVGYGARPFDRLTAMGVDYSGGMWKIRGRVAEAFDPDFPARQRRPQTGVPRSADCASCHTFLDETLETLRARQAAEAPVPANAPVCAPPLVHVASNGTSLIKAETECIQCHNPARNDPRYSGVVTQAFVASGGWPNCSKPTNLPPRDTVPATPITNSCIMPVGHVFTPPGTVCSSCHNSVAARALQDLNPPCAQPGSNELPKLQGTATIVSATEDNGTVIAQGAYTRDTTPQISGTLSAALSSDQGLAVERNGSAIGFANTAGATFSFTDPAAPQGTQVYGVRVVNTSNAFGAISNTWTVRVDSVAPTATVQITGLQDDNFGNIANGGYTTDSTPTLSGTLSAAPATGDVLQVLRNGVLVGTATVTGTTWTYAEPTGLGAGNYTWQARLADAAGNTTAAAQRSAVVLVGVAGASIANVVSTGNVTIAQGSFTADNTPEIRGNVSVNLQSGQLVRVLRNGAPAGVATVSGTSWTFTDNAPEGGVSYTARVEAGAVQGVSSTSYDFSVDSIAPTQVSTITAIRDSFGSTLAPNGTTPDQTPTVDGTLSVAVSGDESVQILRTTVSTGAQVFINLNPAPMGTSWSYTETSLVPAGTYDYQARVFDRAGNVSVFSAARRVTIDPTAVPLPTGTATITAINGITPSGAPASIGLSTDNTPTLSGTLGRTLNAASGEVLRIYRALNGVPAQGAGSIGTATVSGTTWSYTNGTLADGSFTFVVQVHSGASGGLLDSGTYGPSSASAAVGIDATIPTQSITINGIFDDSNVAVGNNNTADTTPRISGILNAALGSGESLVLTRSSVAGTVTLVPSFSTATAWTYTEPSALATGLSYTYSLRVRDLAGNLSVSNPSQAVTLIAALPTVSSIGISGASGGFVASTTPTVFGSISAGLPSGATVRVYRGTAATAPLVGTATVVNTTFWSITDSAQPQGSVSYVARVENGSAYSSTSSVTSATIDTVAPTTLISSISGSSSVMPNTAAPAGSAPYSPPGPAIVSGGTSNDNSPSLSVQLNGALGSNVLRVRRAGNIVTATGAGSCGTNCFVLNVPSPVTLTNNEGGGTVSSTVPSTAGLPTAAQGFTVAVVDPAGNEGTASGTFNIVFNYFACDLTRANATYAQFNAGSSHPGWTGQVCTSCHVGSSTGVTPSGAMLRVPSGITGGTPSYWCRRP